MFNQIFYINKKSSETLAVDVNARNIVNFTVGYFSVKFLSRVKVIKKSITFFIYQIKVSLDCGSLLFNTPDRKDQRLWGLNLLKLQQWSR